LGMLGSKKRIEIRPSWYTNQMMYAIDINQPMMSGCYVPLHVGLASSAEAVFFFRTRH
jgi:hypothetical protein